MFRANNIYYLSLPLKFHFTSHGQTSFLSKNVFKSFKATPFCSPHRCAEKKYPEDLPTISVVLIYLDEALSVIKRAIRSIIDKTPARLLKEIVLVDDHSSNGGSTCWDKTLFLALNLSTGYSRL